MRVISFLLIATLLLLGVTFACLNADSVTVNYYVGQLHLPLSFLLVITFSLGALVGVLFTIFPYLRARTAVFSLSRRLATAEKEIANLRAIPIKDEH